MLDRERIIQEAFDNDVICDYCIHNDICVNTITSNNYGEPIYPPCCDDNDYSYFDVEKYLKDKEDF